MRKVRVFNAHPSGRLRRQETIRLVRYVLKDEGCADADINIVFIDDKLMRRLNNKFLGHRCATDVLSFSLYEKGANDLEGEVYVNVDQARRQSADYSASTREEVRRLVAHGVLHLLGYNDKTASQRRKMKFKEDFYLRKCA